MTKAHVDNWNKKMRAKQDKLDKQKLFTLKSLFERQQQLILKYNKQQQEMLEKLMSPDQDNKGMFLCMFMCMFMYTFV